MPDDHRLGIALHPDVGDQVDRVGQRGAGCHELAVDVVAGDPVRIDDDREPVVRVDSDGHPGIRRDVHTADRVDARPVTRVRRAEERGVIVGRDDCGVGELEPRPVDIRERGAGPDRAGPPRLLIGAPRGRRPWGLRRCQQAVLRDFIFVPMGFCKHQLETLLFGRLKDFCLRSC